MEMELLGETGSVFTEKCENKTGTKLRSPVESLGFFQHW